MTDTRRILGAVALACLWAVPVSAQGPPWAFSRQANIAADNQTAPSTPTSIDVTGVGTLLVDARGTFTGTLTPGCSADGTNYVALRMTPPNSTTAVTSMTTAGLWTGSVAGCRFVRVIGSSWMSGTAVVRLIGVQAGGGNGSGGGGGLEASDLAFGAGTEAAALRVTLPTDGTGVVGIGGTALTEIQEIAENTQDFLDALSLPANEGSPFGAAPDLLPTACRAFDIDASAPPNVVAEDQYIRNLCTLYGAGIVTLVNEAGTVDIGQSITTAVQLLDDAVFTDDASFTPATSKGLAIGGHADDTSTDSVDEGDFGSFRISLDRLLYTRQLDPCSGLAKTYYVVDTADGTNLEIANSVASQFFYICSVNLIAAGATTVLISQDDTDGCGSPEAGLHGGSTGTTTEGWSLAANGGIALGSGAATVMKTSTAARYLCIDQSGSVQLSGTIAYVSAP